MACTKKRFRGISHTQNAKGSIIYFLGHFVTSSGKNKRAVCVIIVLIRVRMVYFLTKSTLPYNITIDYFPSSRIVFAIETLSPQGTARRRCKPEHSYFIIPRQHFYKCSYSRFLVSVVWLDFSVHPSHLIEVLNLLGSNFGSSLRKSFVLYR